MPSITGRALVAKAEHAAFELVDVEFDDGKLADDEVLVRFHASGIWYVGYGCAEGRMC
jgi:NADPH:quinone reductase-like Zn-dependent oxidoreductase